MINPGQGMSSLHVSAESVQMGWAGDREARSGPAGRVGNAGAISEQGDGRSGVRPETAPSGRGSHGRGAELRGDRFEVHPLRLRMRTLQGISDAFSPFWLPEYVTCEDCRKKLCL